MRGVLWLCAPVNELVSFFFKLYAFILLTSTLVPGINYFVVVVILLLFRFVFVFLFCFSLRMIKDTKEGVFEYGSSHMNENHSKRLREHPSTYK